MTPGQAVSGRRSPSMSELNATDDRVAHMEEEIAELGAFFLSSPAPTRALTHRAPLAADGRARRLDHHDVLVHDGRHARLHHAARLRSALAHLRPAVKGPQQAI